MAEGGYGAVLLLDTWALLTRADLRAGRGDAAPLADRGGAGPARPAGGRVVVVADGALAPVQALLRWDPGWFAARELAERRELGFPPAARMASLTGRPAAVAELLDAARPARRAPRCSGPVPAERGPGADAGPGARVGPAGAGRAPCTRRPAVRSARKAAGPVRVQVDPADLF